MGKVIKFINPKVRQDYRQKDEFEVCVACGRKTRVRMTDNVASRPHYIEGAGQLCFDCYVELNRKTL
jgi:hypothetical protein